MNGADRLNLLHLKAYRAKWPWEKMLGSSACLKWGFRDLRHLDEVLRHFTGRRVAVQAGGNLGLFPKRLAEEFETVYTFEPDPQLFQATLKNAPEPNIKHINAAVGFDRTPVSMACRRRDNSGRRVHEGLTHVSGAGKIPQVRIDDLNLDACDLIYLDVEGYELNALRGAQETVTRCRPAITVEVNRNITYYGMTADHIRRWFYDNSYARIFSMDSDELYVHGSNL